MRTVAKPEGVPSQAWVLMLEELYSMVFLHAGLPCMTAKLVNKRELAVFDPHGHLGDPEMRAELARSIGACADPAISWLVHMALLGPALSA